MTEPGHTAGNDAVLTYDSDSDYEPSSSNSDKSDEFSGPPSECSLLWHLVMPHLRPGLLTVPGGVMVSGMSLLEYSIGRDLESPKLMCGRRQTDRYIFYAGKPVQGVAFCYHCMVKSCNQLAMSPCF